MRQSPHLDISVGFYQTYPKDNDMIQQMQVFTARLIKKLSTRDGLGPAH
jgi:hypothetical protein